MRSLASASEDSTRMGPIFLRRGPAIRGVPGREARPSEAEQRGQGSPSDVVELIAQDRPVNLALR